MIIYLILFGVFPICAGKWDRLFHPHRYKRDKISQQIKEHERLEELINESKKFINKEFNFDYIPPVLDNSFKHQLLFKKRLAHSCLESISFDWRGDVIIGAWHASLTIYGDDRDSREIILDTSDLILHHKFLDSFKKTYNPYSLPIEVPYEINKKLISLEKLICEYIRIINIKLNLRDEARQAHRDEILEEYSISKSKELELKRISGNQ